MRDGAGPALVFVAGRQHDHPLAKLKLGTGGNCTPARAPLRTRMPRAAPSCGPMRVGQVIIGMISSATMLATLIMGLIAGPAVSL
jgi:hypothetical protein